MQPLNVNLEGKYPPKIFIYGTPGIDLMKFVSQSRKPVLLDLASSYYDRGNSAIKVHRVGKDIVDNLGWSGSLSLFSQLEYALHFLLEEDHGYKTVVLNSICALDGAVTSLLSGYEDDYDTAYTEIIQEHLSTRLEQLNKEREMTVIFAENDTYSVSTSVLLDEVQNYNSSGIEDPKALKRIDLKMKDWLLRWNDCVLVGYRKFPENEDVIATVSSNEMKLFANSKIPLPPELPLDFKVFWKEFVSATRYQAQDEGESLSTTSTCPF